MKEIYFHIGLPKTGSTFLQREVYPKMKNIKYIYRYGIEQRVFDLVDLNNNKKVLFSDESYLFNNVDRLLKTKRLKSIYDDCKKNKVKLKIIFFIRRQDNYAHSLYLQAIKQGYPLSINKFYMHILKNKKTNFKYYNTPESDSFNYYTIIKQIKLYSDDILVVPYEKLKDNPNKAIDRLCKYIGVDTPNYRIKKYNYSLGLVFMNILRILNWTFRTKFNNISPLPRVIPSNYLNTLGRFDIPISKPNICYDILEKQKRNNLKLSKLLKNKELKIYKYCEGKE